ncbi:bifunctional riboflavin kinase/FAD synthetase [Candidatus Uabimicrobium amorphum]|uniref:Riboflavin biosynthesis protein n=1 Tax=Uabimicrobium amorphum TaxID=2596890 RepID=A0A5S9F3W4_UABAM|nr:bifunctional riboflavin kinase/FAD synthetase [Candidatus Uabimicrobium amorphum]BBM85116.1 riboflavin biosynthesis protein [Candidatus Uabimicrobium amorphum]
MKTLNFFDVMPQQIKSPIVTMGFFDGVHIGHQQLVKRVVKHAEEVKGTPTVITFVEHPLKTITGSAPPSITSLRKRLKLLARFNIAYTLLIEFDHNVAKIDPKEFIEKFLVANLQMRGIVIGENFRFGHRGAGTPDLLKKMSAEHSFFTDVQSHREWSGNVVSSTKIREAIKRGDCQSAHEMLSRPFSLCGTVIEGQKRGRKLGFPTANLSLEHTLVPGDGVYIGSVELNGKRYPSLISIGTNPTFDGQSTSTEVYIEGFDEDIYNQYLEVFVLDKIRDQIKFNDADELVARMNKDKEVLMQKFDTLKASISAT